MAPITNPVSLGAPPPRQDLYLAPHKALRMFMADTQLRIGALDTEDPVAAALALAQLRDLLVGMRHHQMIEDKFVLPALEARRPGAMATNAREHRHHEESMASLEDLADQVKHAVTGAAADRVWLSHRLYLAVSRFVSENLEHMVIEETHINPMLWSLFSDEELRVLLADILAWETPAQVASSVRWMIPSLSPAERVHVVGSARPMMPAPVFDELLAYACTLLPDDDATKLRAAIGS